MNEQSEEKIVIYSDGTWTMEELEHMVHGGVVDRNGHRYAMCFDCHKVVCLDKTFFGSAHFCE
jgi:hypothetical protein